MRARASLVEIFGRRRIALANHRRRSSIEWSVLGKLRDRWGRWRESQRQYQLELALYKMNGGYTVASEGRTFDNDLFSSTTLPRLDAPKGNHAPDLRAE